MSPINVHVAPLRHAFCSNIRHINRSPRKHQRRGARVWSAPRARP
jgi:hypothetical protein